MIKKNNTTIDDLAVMVQKGFDGVEKRFEKIDERFMHVDESLSHIGSRLACIEADVNALRGEVVLRNEFDDALARIKYLEKKLNIVSGK